MADAPGLGISVVYAEAGRVFEVALRLPAGATVADAIGASGLREVRPDIEIRADRLGIFSRKATFETPLRDGDRVEIYRPLGIDPKDARRRRAEESVRK
jgi:putative ubiquitin-RnfH superfamily antitoxin RatB of RatAB toxin-antitoxin module